MSFNGNPFLSLFNTEGEAREFIQKKEKAARELESRENNLLQQIFLFTTDPVSNKRSKVLHLVELPHLQAPDNPLNLENLQYLLYGRLMSVEEIKDLIKNSVSSPEQLRRSPAYERNPIKYLYESFERMVQLFPEHLEPFEQDVVYCNSYDDENVMELRVWRKCWEAIRDQAILFFEMPHLIQDFDPMKHFLHLVMQITFLDTTDQFTFYALLISHMGTDTDKVLEIVRPALQKLLEWTRSAQESGLTPNFRIPHGLQLFAKKPCLAMALLKFDREIINNQRSVERSLLGGLLSLGSRPHFFQLLTDNLYDPRYLNQGSIDGLEKEVQMFLEEVQWTMAKLFNKMILLPGVCKELMIWIGDALHYYKDRNKLWSFHFAQPLAINSSDSFLLNLQFVLLELYSNILNSPCTTSASILIDPSYGSAMACTDRSETLARNVHMRDVSVTRLIPAQDDQGNLISSVSSEQNATATAMSATASPVLSAIDTSALLATAALATPRVGTKEKYCFATEMYFMIHSCCNLGFSLVSEKLVKANQEIHLIRERYKDAVDQGMGNSPRALELKDQLGLAVTIFYSIKAALTQEFLMEKYLTFCVLSADYLVHIGKPGDHLEKKEEIFSLVDGNVACILPSPSLQHIPEFHVQNVRSFLLFLRRFKDEFFEKHPRCLGKLLNFLLLFMSESKFIHNPHLRAEMAEALECLFPRPDDHLANRSMFISDNSSVYREKLLVNHKNARYITHCLMGLFVGMEATGQGVQFENKFRYRQPMYVMFKYLWKLDIHKQALKDAVKYAEQHLEDADAPLFLRFVNLLINDSIYLLDEALSLMSQIKEKQLAKESGQWDALPPNQRQEMENSLKHLGQLARFHNIMGVETIETLATLTANVRSIFEQNIMVDRLAHMLNYFLLHLVGPKKLNLKVKNPEEFRFEPKKFVSQICRIYENLSDSEKFLKAVSSDGRSYSQDLFVRAGEVMCKIREPLDRIMKFDEISQKIKELAVEHAKEEEPTNIPDEYLDPIMGTIMEDPVLLPSSGKVVDRQTISRHILSDQTDPFNRQPLTMNMVAPAVELKLEIDNWLAKNKNSYS